MLKKTILFIIALLFIVKQGYGEISFDGFINSDNVNIRVQPHTQSESSGILKRGTWVRVLKKSDQKDTIDGMSNYWYYCELDNSQCKGWIFAEFISKGVFDSQKYLNSLPTIKIPDNFRKLINKWSSCNPKVKKEGMGCYPLVITDKYIKNDSIMNSTYQIIEVISKGENEFLLKLKLIMYIKEITSSYHDSNLGISGNSKEYDLRIRYNVNEKTIFINELTKYYISE